MAASNPAGLHTKLEGNLLLQRINNWLSHSHFYLLS